MSHEEQTRMSARRAQHRQEAEPGSNWLLEVCMPEVVGCNVSMLHTNK